ncbi:TetR/AcrR family transcriptional regulator [uncultured Cocleimonas sp.]|uniref:acrylate utilization transcriptional regulator AcuR n=1 Tax=uncultured Cocleimonas sp. TaxID=1051587 RepID=UPI00260FD496|nr:TetR/AcrR family transcriptional regulator [uncultured Cocleimonas sp.]
MTTKSDSKINAKKRGRPAKGGLGFDDTREALIRCGMELLTEQGFNNTGLDQILKKVNVPKGSFYHYFENKEAYGYVVLEEYSQFFIHKLKKHLLNKELPALERLQAFIEDAIQGVERYDFKRGCLVGNLTLELGSSHEQFREKLNKAFNNWKSLIADCLELAKTEGTLAETADSDQLADFFWICWEGAVMRAKLTQNKQPMELFSQQFFKLLP